MREGAGVFIILIIPIVLGLIPAAIANSKGHSFVGWWLYGALLWIVALPHALMLRPDARTIETKALADGELRKCPRCAELVKREAKVCRFCGHGFDAEAAPAADPAPT